MHKGTEWQHLNQLVWKVKMLQQKNKELMEAIEIAKRERETAFNRVFFTNAMEDRKIDK